MRFEMTVESVNQAMVDAPIEEVTEMLHTVIGRMPDGYTGGVLLDSNGNTVGQWALIGERDCPHVDDENCEVCPPAGDPPIESTILDTEAYE